MGKIETDLGSVIGPKGPKGDKGDKGDVGETGAQGPAGKDGESIKVGETPETARERKIFFRIIK